MNNDIYTFIANGYTLEEIADYFEITRLEISRKVTKIFAEKEIKSITIKSKV